ncbi:hypothetical protein ACQP2P_30450 [Dactylosporangium sp. CA-139114]|uniref:hypothetical protein n=1 Tax=Dactylosporangium sp. CA-139114 TaxID=3239931 RepID=UPI003D9998BC
MTVSWAPGRLLEMSPWSVVSVSGVSGTVAGAAGAGGVTGADGPAGDDGPAAEFATTVTVYVVPAVAPSTHVSAPVVVHPATSVPESGAGAVQLTVMEETRAVAVTVPGASSLGARVGCGRRAADGDGGDAGRGGDGAGRVQPWRQSRVRAPCS